MASKRTVPTRAGVKSPSISTVDEFMRGLNHPLKPALELVRTTIRNVSPSIPEGIKWNAPSFALAGSGRFFATVNIHGTKKTRECVLLVLHQERTWKRSGARRLRLT